MVTIIVCSVLAIVVLWFIVAYNNLIRQKNMLHESLSGIAVQQKRRYDLIPNLVNTVSGYSVHEKEVLQSIVQLRSSAMQGGNSSQGAAADGNLSGALKTLFALSENYPDLKANQNFLSLQQELVGIEAELQYARRYYNGVARNYNNAIHTFPSVIVASMFNYKEVEYFVLADAAQADAPVVKF
jgi:LemA protein